MALVTVAPSGGDYTSLSAAEAGEQQDLTSLAEPMEIECAAMSDTTAVSIDGWTTSGTYYLEIRAATGAHARMPWSTSAYRLSASDYFAALNLEEANVRLRRIQVENTRVNADGSQDSAIRLNGGVTGGEVRLLGLHVRRTLATGTGDNALIHTRFVGNNQTVVIANCFGNGSHRGISLRSVATAGAKFVLYNNTFVNAVGTNYHMECYWTGSLYFRNNLGYGATGTDFYKESAVGTESVTHNASEDATAVGTSARTSQTFTFVDGAGGDFHLTSGDGGGRDFGVDLSADAQFAFSDDFDAETRSGSWDIGCDEYVAAGGSIVPKVYDYRRRRAA